MADQTDIMYLYDAYWNNSFIVNSVLNANVVEHVSSTMNSVNTSYIYDAYWGSNYIMEKNLVDSPVKTES